MNVNFWSVARRTSLLITIVGIAFLSNPFSTYAQATGESVNWEDLNISNGWTCNADKSACTRGSAQGTDKASCTSTRASLQSETIIHTCYLTKANGDTAAGASTVGAGGAVNQTVSETTDGQANNLDTANVGAQQRAEAGGDAGCGISDIGQCIIDVVGSAILGFTNLFLSLAGLFLNWVVVKTVFQFGDLIGNSPGLLIAWGILRDIGNMVLLFGFILMGLGTILDLHSFPTRKAIPRLLIFAILMNFSLFAAEAVIDTSNALSSALYSQANTDPCLVGTATEGGTLAERQDCAVNYGIAGHIMQSTGLSSMFDTGGESFASITTYLMLALFAVVGAIVLAAAGIMLVIRVVVLSFLMVSAPIGFAGMAIPQLHSFAQSWWKRLFSQAFFAPAMFLLIFVSLKITDSFTADGTNSSLAGAVTQPGSSVMGIIMVFAIVIGFMIASLVVAKRIGDGGASFGISLATSAVYGGMARGTNAVVGGGAYKLRQFQQRNAPNSAIGKFANKRILTPLTTANLDARRIPGMSKLLSTAGAGKGAEPGEHISFADMKHQYEDFRDNKKGQQGERDYQNRVSTQRLEDDAHNGALSDTSKQELTKYSVKQLEELHGIKEGLTALSENLSPEQFEGLMKSDKLSDLEKTKIRNGRYAGITAFAAASDEASVKQLLGSMGKKDLEGLPSDVLVLPIILNNLSDKQREDLGGSDKRSASEKVLIKASSKVERIKADFETVGGAGIVNGTGQSGFRVSDLSREQIAKLPKNVLTDAAVVGTYTPRILMALQEEKGKFTDADISSISRQIQIMGQNHPAYQYIYGQDAPGAAFWR